MKVNYDTGFQLSVMDARLKKMRKQRDEYKKQRDELIGDIAKLRERNKELESKLNDQCNSGLKIEGQLYDVARERDELI